VSREEIPQNTRNSDKTENIQIRQFLPIFDGSEDPTVRLLTETDVEVDNLMRLVEKAPPTADHAKEWNKLYWEWDKLRMQIFERPELPMDQKPKEDPQIIARRNREYYLSVQLTSSKMRMVAAEILDDAHSTKERLEHRLKIFTPISYVLFCLGVMVTIVSKTFGLDPGANAEE